MALLIYVVQLWLLVWVSINQMFDMLFTGTCQRRLKVIIKSLAEQDAMVSFPKLFYTIQKRIGDYLNFSHAKRTKRNDKWCYQKAKKASTSGQVEFQSQEKAVKRVVNYCESNICRRKTLMKHFGEDYLRNVESVNYKCCDVCQNSSGVAKSLAKISSVSVGANSSKISLVSGSDVSFPELFNPFKLNESDYIPSDPRMNRKQ
mmetsp:Transcript_10528/g.12010  ORF Transcript_10528/g.12010 Transcript_10528/m.12010 type:complete len:203 (-) Transcript_10528:183-791(-)